MYAILDGKNVIPEPDVIKWAQAFETQNRKVAHTVINKRRNIVVSTVFLGIDHGDTKRLWFETLIFGTSIDGTMNRYETWDEAERGHQKMVHRARQARQVKFRPYRIKQLTNMA